MTQTWKLWTLTHHCTTDSMILCTTSAQHFPGHISALVFTQTSLTDCFANHEHNGYRVFSHSSLHPGAMSRTEREDPRTGRSTHWTSTAVTQAAALPGDTAAARAPAAPTLAKQGKCNSEPSQCRGFLLQCQLYFATLSDRIPEVEKVWRKAVYSKEGFEEGCWMCPWM